MSDKPMFPNGPWSVNYTPERVPFVADKSNYLIAVVENGKLGVKDSNAKLIAAAPELLAALQNIIKKDRLGGLDNSDISQCIEVVFKALG